MKQPLLRINNLRVALDDDTPLAELAARRLKLPRQAVTEAVIVRKALDARRKSNIQFVYSLEVTVKSLERKVLARLRIKRDVLPVRPPVAEPVLAGDKPLTERPVVIGLGPAGMLAALTLARHGYRPLVLERGRAIEHRTQDVNRFWQTGKFDAVSNVQFGEGGAGTFSDGKLTTRVHDPRMQEVLQVFLDAGAPPEIRYAYKPHIGTDQLRTVVKAIRQQILKLGGEIRFESQVTDVTIQDGRLRALIVNGSECIPCQAALLAVGHSARDTCEMLDRRGLAMEVKPFAVGVRIEHPQELIDQAQYGAAAGHPKLGAADYALVYHDKASGRTAYSFCMCPGGLVVAAASEAGRVVTNGMSLFQRASGLANSALVVNVQPADCGGGILHGLEFQRHYETLAFQQGGGGYRAPMQTVGGFLGRTGGGYLSPPSYRPGVKTADLRRCLPDFVAATLAKALPNFARTLSGFDHPDAVMTGVETRTSSPVRLPRDERYVSINTAGLYPVGEGAGYAGGIMSAALDGLNAAIAVIREYKV